MNMLIYHYDAFSNIPNRGNPAGVVLNASHSSKCENKLPQLT
jgi:predicted PhzF superfamily epimerase YddE/YHI9